MDYKDFRKKIIDDSSFAAKFKGIQDIAELVEAAAAEGYTFTEEEVKDYTELLPEELAYANGGLAVSKEMGDMLALNPDVINTTHIMNTDVG